MRNSLPRLALTMGDPLGIGPEIILKTLSSPEVWKICKPVVYGSAFVFRFYMDLLGLNMSVNIIDENSDFLPNVINVYPVVGFKVDKEKIGKIDEEAGDAAYRSFVCAIDDALNNKVEAIVTAPLNKKAMNLAGHDFSGHTDILGKAAKEKTVMMFSCPDLKVSLVTVHVALSDVPELITMHKVLHTIVITHDSLIKDFGIKSPSIGVCGLNPHAGEDGLFGSEEKLSIKLAIKKAQMQGIDVKGPFPADAIFTPVNRVKYSAIVAMYHDQGLIPVKTICFDKAVNVTLNLPFVRTSPDHGTAFDIAGKGVASPVSFIEAVKLAGKIVQCRRNI